MLGKKGALEGNRLVAEISGMTCGSCAASLKEKIEVLPAVTHAEVNHQTGTAAISFAGPLTVADLAGAIETHTKYTLRGIEEPAEEKTSALPPQEDGVAPEEEQDWLQTYKPLLLIVGLLLGITVAVQYPFSNWSWHMWARHFMAGFFLAFGFFKLLDLKGFASTYSGYDWIARSWPAWGYVYPFVELALGFLYLVGIASAPVLWATIAVLAVGTGGVIESNLRKNKIRCACLGTVFNLPMSTVTIAENVSMIAMAAVMLLI